MAILFAAFVILENKKEYEKRYPGCWQLIGENLECKANAAANRLMR